MKPNDGGTNPVDVSLPLVTSQRHGFQFPRLSGVLKHCKGGKSKQRKRQRILFLISEIFLKKVLCFLTSPLLTVSACFFFFLPRPQAWLQQYGYLPSADPRMSVLRSPRVMQSAIAAMQRRYGLNVTGSLDSNTIE